jgi:hypothetical protein
MPNTDFYSHCMYDQEVKNFILYSEDMIMIIGVLVMIVIVKCMRIGVIAPRCGPLVRGTQDGYNMTC